MKYYYLHFKDDNGCVAKASFDYNYPTKKEIKNDFFFKVDKVPQDYLANDLGWPLMSELMMSHINELLKKINVNWKKINVQYKLKSLNYFVPVFNEKIDILNIEKSIFSKANFVVKCHLSLEKVLGYDFFQVPNSDLRLIVSLPVKLRLEKNRISGLDFSLCPAS
ncbi:DUF1629 domain-containing protein [Flavobacterium sp.]|uniref:imm11 family protein n=1 Tax=Flavobacterium sp. TaxID=239 RepID=UPI0031DFA916